MNDFVLSCCSTADLTAEHFAARDIHYICFHYSLNGKQYADDLGKSMPFDQFYQAMEVSVNHLARTEWRFMYLAAILVTALFYFILGYFQTANLVPSTLSVTTSFIAVYLTYKRSPYYALGYAANDIVLIVLWILAARQNTSYLSVVVCFTAFLVNDIYGFINWCRMGERQAESV